MGARVTILKSTELFLQGFTDGKNSITETLAVTMDSKPAKASERWTQSGEATKLFFCETHSVGLEFLHQTQQTVQNDEILAFSFFVPRAEPISVSALAQLACVSGSVAGLARLAKNMMLMSLILAGTRPAILNDTKQQPAGVPGGGSQPG